VTYEASKEGPFVILARDGKGERSFATLKGAVEKARSGDTIEVRGDGPFLCEPADAGTKALCIRAGDGYRPVLLGGKQTKPTLNTNGPLVLEGLDMRREAVEGGAGNLWAHDQSVRISHCRFLAAGQYASVNLIDSPAADFQHTYLLSRHSWSCLQSQGKRQGAVLSISQCLCCNSLTFNVEGDKQSMRQLEVSLRANTFLGPNVWLDVQTHDPAVFEAGEAARKPALRLELSDNLVASPRFGTFWHSNEVGPGLEAMEAFLKKQVRWAGARNRFGGGSEGLHFAHEGKQGSMRLKDLKGWKEWWGQESPFELGEVKFKGGDLIARLKKGETPEPGDFRPLGAAAKFGADVDKLGPGKPYHEWKKTPEYSKWQKKTRELLDGKKE
jgi:hypothetical protein